VNPEHLVVEEERTYSDHREEDTDGAENGLGGCDAGDLLREIRGFNGYVQCGESPVAALRLLGSGRHYQNSSVTVEAVPVACERNHSTKRIVLTGHSWTRRAAVYNSDSRISSSQDPQSYLKSWQLNPASPGDARTNTNNRSHESITP